jgi:hypothetical protein
MSSTQEYAIISTNNFSLSIYWYKVVENAHFRLFFVAVGSSGNNWQRRPKFEVGAVKEMRRRLSESQE